MSKIMAFDVSKQTLDVAYYKDEVWHHFKTSNNIKGFKEIEEHLETNDKVVMEASGPYFVKVANYLFEKGFKVSVVNPLRIKHYCRMMMQRAKTDKKDAISIAEYAMSYETELWQPDDPEIYQMQQLTSSIELINKQITQLKNQYGSFKVSGTLKEEISELMKTHIENMKEQREKLKAIRLSIAKESYAVNLKKLIGINGIGENTAIILIIITNNFKNFDDPKKLIAFIGTSPRIHQSGSSVNGKGHICKMGNAVARKNLYMATLTAVKCNPACKEMYDRMKAKGKPEKVIRVAVSNKLVRQALAIVLNDTTYDENYMSNYKLA